MPLRKPGPKPNPPGMTSKSALCHDPLHPPEQDRRRCTACGNWFMSLGWANRKCRKCADVYVPVKPPRYNR